MFRLRTGAWSRLSNMTSGRYYFTPCVYQAQAYLCMATDTTIDVLDLASRRFRSPLPVHLPEEEYYTAVSVVVGDELIVITESHSTAVDLSTMAAQTTQREKNAISPVSTPVAFNNCVYWVNNLGECLRASGKKLSILEKVC